MASETPAPDTTRGMFLAAEAAASSRLDGETIVIGGPITVGERSAPEPAHTSGHIDNETTDALDALFDRPVRVKFWVCPDHRRGRVEWTGSVATCLDCGRTNATPPVSGEDTAGSGVGLDAIERLERITADLDAYIALQAEIHARPAIEKADTRARVAEQDREMEVQRREDLAEEFRRQLVALERGQNLALNERDRARAKLAEAVSERDQARAAERAGIVASLRTAADSLDEHDADCLRAYAKRIERGDI